MATHTTPSLCPNGYTHHTIPVAQWLHTPQHPCAPMATHTTPSLCPNGYTHHTIPVAQWLHTPQHPCALMASHTTPSLWPSTTPYPHTPHHPCGPLPHHTPTHPLYFSVLTSCHQCALCPATGHHRECRSYQTRNPHWKNTTLNIEQPLEVKIALCTVCGICVHLCVHRCVCAHVE